MVGLGPRTQGATGIEIPAVVQRIRGVTGAGKGDGGRVADDLLSVGIRDEVGRREVLYIDGGELAARTAAAQLHVVHLNCESYRPPGKCGSRPRLREFGPLLNSQEKSSEGASLTEGRTAKGDGFTATQIPRSTGSVTMLETGV
jgi:hypothetical protein